MLNMVSRFIFLIGLAIAGAAAADSGRAMRVTITTGVAIPDPEAVVEALFSGPEENRAVRVERHNSGPTTTLQIDLWGTTVAEADIPNTLRRRFPELSTAGISTSTIDSPRPAIDDGGALRRKIIHKELRTSP